MPQNPTQVLPSAKNFFLPSVIEPLLVCTKTAIIRDLLAFFIGPLYQKRVSQSTPRVPGTPPPKSYFLAVFMVI